MENLVITNLTLFDSVICTSNILTESKMRKQKLKHLHAKAP